MKKIKDYDCDTIEVDLSHKEITKIRGLERLTRLQELVLYCNEITEIKGLETLTQLQELDLGHNRITEIKRLGTLTQLQKLVLSINQITEIKGLEKLTQLQRLDLSDNQITEIKGFNGLTQLQELYLGDNQITEIKGLNVLTQLQILYLVRNQIAEIKGLNTLTQLKVLMLYDNQITKIEGLDTLTQLQILQLNRNKITKIEGLETLLQLHELGLIDNQITEIPMTIMMCKRLGTFYYNDNLYINPIIKRFLNRNKAISNDLKVYDNSQNVHDSSINKSITESMYRIIQESKVDTNSNILSEIVNDNVLNQLTKKSLIEYSNNPSIHSTLNVTFNELLVPVWNIIKNHENSNEIKEVLNIEMQDSLCKCFTGRLSRLINCLNGFDSRVLIKISESDEIANIIILVRNKYGNDTERQRMEVVKEMTDRKYDKQIIDEWLSYLE